MAEFAWACHAPGRDAERPCSNAAVAPAGAPRPVVAGDGSALVVWEQSDASSGSGSMVIALAARRVDVA